MQSEPKKRKRKKKRSKNWTYLSSRHFTKWATSGRQVLINGKEHTVYSRAKLVEAFGRYGVPKTPTTLRLWEKAGILPQSPIFISNKYFYTQSMIECIVLTYIECGNDKVLTNTEYFKTRVWEEFNKVVQKELF